MSIKYICENCGDSMEIEEDIRTNNTYYDGDLRHIVPICHCQTLQLLGSEEMASKFEIELMDAQDKIGAMTKSLTRLNKLLSGSKNKNNLEAIELIIKTLDA